jgi:zinc transporter ZupT
VNPRVKKRERETKRGKERKGKGKREEKGKDSQGRAKEKETSFPKGERGSLRARREEKKRKLLSRAAHTDFGAKMDRLLLLSLVTIGVCSASVAAASSVSTRRDGPSTLDLVRRGSAEPDKTALLKKYDENKDGLLDEHEFEEMFMALYGPKDAHAHEEEAHAEEKEIKMIHPDDEEGKCFDPHEIIFESDANKDESLNQTELTTACVILVNMVLEKCKVEPAEDCSKMDPGMQWLAGLVSAVIVSLVSLIAVALFPVARSQKATNLLLAFAVGALVGDAVLHLIPESLGVHGHGAEDGEEDEKAYLGPACMVLIGIAFFFVLERQLSHFHSHSHSHGGHQEMESDDIDIDVKKSPSSGGRHDEVFDMDSHYSSNSSSSSGSGSGSESDGASGSSTAPTEDAEDSPDTTSTTESAPVWWQQLQYQPLGYMSLIADGLHNFVDGIAIGVAFTLSLPSGLATAIAVFCHELPQELAEFTILVRAGFTKVKAVLWNFISGLTAILGVVVGLGIGQAMGEAKLWIVAFIAGGFLYIALSDMVAELLQEKGTKETIKQFCAIMLGFVLMLILALFVEDIKIEC